MEIEKMLSEVAHEEIRLCELELKNKIENLKYSHDVMARKSLVMLEISSFFRYFQYNQPINPSTSLWKGVVTGCSVCPPTRGCNEDDSRLQYSDREENDLRFDLADHNLRIVDVLREIRAFVREPHIILRLRGGAPPDEEEGGESGDEADQEDDVEEKSSLPDLSLPFYVGRWVRNSDSPDDLVADRRRLLALQLRYSIWTRRYGLSLFDAFLAKLHIDEFELLINEFGAGFDQDYHDWVSPMYPESTFSAFASCYMVTYPDHFRSMRRSPRSSCIDEGLQELVDYERSESSLNTLANRVADFALPKISSLVSFVDNSLVRIGEVMSVEVVKPENEVTTGLYISSVVLIPIFFYLGLFDLAMVFYFYLGMTSMTALISMYRQDPALVNAVVISTVVVALCLGVAPMALFGICIQAPLAEEQMKRSSKFWYGGVGPWVFGFGEMAIYILAFGPEIALIRLLLVFLHVFWAQLPIRQGVMAHWCWNTACVCLIVLYQPAVFLIYALGCADRQSALVYPSVITAVLFGFFCLFLLFFYGQQHAPHFQGGSPLNVHDYVIHSARQEMFVRKGGRLVKLNKFPYLRRFRQWEHFRDSQFYRDWSSLCDLTCPASRKFYFLVVASMQSTPSLRMLMMMNALQKEMAAESHNAEMHALNGNINVDDIAGLRALISKDCIDEDFVVVLLKVISLWYHSSPPSMWVTCFLDIVLPFGAQAIEEVTRLSSLFDLEGALEMFKTWMSRAIAPSHQGVTSFMQSPLYLGFVRLLTSIVSSVFFKQYIPARIISSVMNFESFLDFFASLSSLMEMSYDSFRLYYSTGLISSFLSSGFAELEAELDVLVALPLPDRCSKDFYAERDKRIVLLEVKLDELLKRSRAKPELTNRYQTALAKVNQIRELALRSQLGVCPVSELFMGEAGTSKSNFAREVINVVLTYFDAIPTGAKAENVIHVVRENGTKHMDGILEIEQVKAILMDDMQQYRGDREVLAKQVNIFHTLVSFDKTPLPFADLAQKAKSTQLNPMVLFMTTNNRGFLEAHAFDRNSIARRLDLAVEVRNKTGVEFSVDHRPERSDVFFIFYKMRYEVGIPDAIFEPFALEGILSTDDRLEARRLVSNYTISKVKAKSARLAELLDSSVCPANGLVASDHFGIPCADNCMLANKAVLAVHQSHLYGIAIGFSIVAVFAYLRTYFTRGFWRAFFHVTFVYFFSYYLPFQCERLGDCVTCAVGLAAEETKLRAQSRTELIKSWGLSKACVAYYAGIDFDRMKKRLVGLVTVVCVIAVAVKGFSAVKSHFAGSIPERDNEEVKEYRETRRAISRQMRKVDKPSGKLEDVKLRVLASLLTVVPGENAESGRVSGYAQCSQKEVVICTHMVTECLNFWAFINSGDETSGQRWRTNYVEGANDRNDLRNSDTSILSCSGNMRRDLAPHLVDFDAARTFHGKALLFTGKEWVEIVVRPKVNYSLQGEVIAFGFEYDCPFETYIGMCGLPVVAPTGSGTAFQLGYHHAGWGRLGFGQYVYVGMFSERGFELEPAAGFLSSIVPVSDAVFQSGSCLKEDIIDFKDKVPTSFLPLPAWLLGSLDRPTKRLNTKLRESFLAAHFPEGGSEFYGPAKLRDVWDKEKCEAQGPLATLARRPQGNLSVDSVAIAKAIDDLRLDSVSLADDLKKVAPISLRQALNGIPGTLKSVDLDTSPGYPLAGKKRDHVSGDVGNLKVNQVIQEQLDDFVKRSKDREIPVVACAKDEIRPIAKIWMARMFFILPFWFLLLCRCMLSHFFLVWRSRRDITECSVGINAGSKQWNMVGEPLDRPAAPGQTISFFCTDFSKFDKCYSAFIKTLVYSYIVFMLNFTSFSDSQRNLTSDLLSCLLNMVVILVNELFLMFDWHPSGDPITVEVNSIAQRIIFRYWFFRSCPERMPGDFKFWVTLFTYGDDGLARVVDDARLTQYTLRDCSKELDFDVTSSTKGELTPFVKREDLTFLKRGIIFDEEFEGYRAPLEEASIYKMLCWYDGSSSISEGTWAVQVCANAAAEWFLHGRVRFEAEVIRLKEVCRIESVAYLGKTFDEYLASYLANDFTTWSLDYEKAASDLGFESWVASVIS